MTTWKCQCANPDCDLTVEVSKKTAQEFRNLRWHEGTKYQWIVIVNGCKAGPPIGYKLLRRNIFYDIYSSCLPADIESAVETADITQDPKFLEDLRQSVQEMGKGESAPWEQIKKELDL